MTQLAGKGVPARRFPEKRYPCANGSNYNGGVMQRYEANLPSVGLVSFMKSPICEDFSKIDADVAILGVPYDAGIGFRPGTRFGPRDIRQYSVRYSGWGGWKSAGYWDINDKRR